MHLLFNGADLANLFSFAVSQDPTKPIDLLTSPLHPASSIPAQHVVPHLHYFLSLSGKHLSEGQVVELVASALLTQFNTPTAHCRSFCLLITVNMELRPQQVIGLSEIVKSKKFLTFVEGYRK
jgi:hypothetical protein